MVFMSVEKGDKLGKGSWQDKTWTGGNLEITVNLKDMTIKMQKAEGKKIYAIGNFQGWDINKDNCALGETAPNSNIYEGTFDVTDPAGGIECEAESKSRHQKYTIFFHIFFSCLSLPEPAGSGSL